MRAPLIRRGAGFAGRFTPPGDKSITHRAYLFGLLAEGETRVLAGNPGEDCARSLAAARALGAQVAVDGEGVVIAGTAGRLSAPAVAIDCGNSGTSMRLLAGMLAGRTFASELRGDASLSRRPMARILAPLAAMGARIGASAGERPPLSIAPARLSGIAHASAVASAQVETCVLLAGLSAAGETSVMLPGPARDHTARMLPLFGVNPHVQALANGGRRTRIRGGERLHGATLRVPGDFSAAAFFLAAAAAEPGARVTALGVDLNPTRAGLLEVLAAMGAEVRIEHERSECGEPVGDVTVTGPERLRAFAIPPEWVPRLIDEIPAWVIAASAAEGTSRLSGANELRVKESDRIVALARNLAAVGIAVREQPDGLELDGGPVRGARIEAHLDHRIVMAFAGVGARTSEPMSFDDVSSVETSYPGFFQALAALGARVEDGAPA